MRLKTAMEFQKKVNDAYAERDKCVYAVAALAEKLGYPVGMAKHPDNDVDWDDDWMNIVSIELPTGQVTWHIHDDEMPYFERFPKIGNQWDGHSTEEKYQRVLAL